MSKVDRLKPFVEAVVEKPACTACKSFAPECLVPVGDGAVPMCWLCAHHVIEHDTAVEHAHAAECECVPTEIYPSRVLAARHLNVGIEHSDEMKPGDWSRQRQSEIDAAVDELRKLTPKQREIVLQSVGAVAEHATGSKAPKPEQTQSHGVDRVVLVGDERKLWR